MLGEEAAAGIVYVVLGREKHIGADDSAADVVDVMGGELIDVAGDDTAAV